MIFPARLKTEFRPDMAQSSLARFCADRRGNVAMMVALCAMAMLGLVGVALDFSRTMMVRTSMQDALDAAVLAAAELQSRGGASMADLRAIANAMISANETGSVAHVCAEPVLTRNVASGRVSMDMACDTPTTLSAVLGFPKLSFTVASTAEYARTQLDVAMMLDVTGSMSGQKLKDLKAAAKLLVDTVVDPTGAGDDVRVALAPFSASVNAGGYFLKATNIPPGAVRCVTERVGGQAYTDAAPGAGAYSAAGPNNCPGASIVPLAHDPVALKARIDAFSAGGMTAGHLGVAWARYLISPKWSGVWPAASAPLSYGEIAAAYYTVSRHSACDARRRVPDASPPRADRPLRRRPSRSSPSGNRGRRSCGGGGEAAPCGPRSARLPSARARGSQGKGRGPSRSAGIRIGADCPGRASWRARLPRPDAPAFRPAPDARSRDFP